MDPDGEWAEAVFIEGPSIAVGVHSLISNVKQGNVGSAIVDAVGVVADTAAAIAPGIPGGVGLGIKAKRASKTFDQARREAFEKAGMTDPSKVSISKYDEKTGTAVEFKGAGGAKVGYDGPHTSPGAHHDTQHISWQSAGKRGQGGAQRGNTPYSGPRHPSRSKKKK